MRSMAMRAWATVLVTSLLLSCAGNRAAIADAILMGTLAATVAAERRAEGDCYVPCAFGTVCNPETGYCEPLPCHGTCAPNEYCLQSATEEHCEPIPSPDMSVGRRQGEPPGPPFVDGPVEEQK